MGKITYNDKVKINELTDVPAINKVQDVDMNEIKTSVNTIYDALGTGTDTYSTSTSYVVGDMVIYNGMIYKCINATSGTWNPVDWSLVPIFENDMINESLLPKEINYCWASMSGDYTIQTINTQETLPINTKTMSSGSKLNVTSDGIVIGAGISAVMVSAQVYWYSNCADSEGIIYISKNGQNLYANNHRITDLYEHQASATVTIPVVEGDVIRLKVTNNHKTALIKNYYSGTFLIVTAIK